VDEGGSSGVPWPSLTSTSRLPTMKDFEVVESGSRSIREPKVMVIKNQVFEL
jgi:hypothetical protein